MKRFFILFIAILFGRYFSTGIISLNAADKPIVTEKRIISKWDNGQTLREESYRIVGKAKSVQHGPATEYFENGKKRLEVEYANGKLNGLLTEYDALNGIVIRQGKFENNLETGKWTWWQPTGDKLAECTYKEGKIVGKKNYWFNGKLIVEETYNGAGELVQYTSWHNDAKSEKPQMEKQGAFKNGKKDGKWTYWNPDGTIKAQGEWKKGKPWNGVCGVPEVGDAGSWGGLEHFSRFANGRQVDSRKGSSRNEVK